jgi:hypothetical protein
MKARKRQSLWDLLACASRVRVTEGFCQEVTLRARSIRQHSASPTLSAVSAAAALLVLGIAATVLLWPAPPQFVDGTASGSQESSGQESCTDEFETVVLMDELLAVNDPTQLDDEALAKLMFH